MAVAESTRLKAVEQLVADLNRRTMELLETDKYHDARLISLEAKDVARQLAEAREAERDISTQAWRANVEANFKTQRENASRLFWLVAGALVIAFVGFIVKGGLSLS